MVKNYQVVSCALLLVSCSGIAHADEETSRRIYNAIDTSNVETMQRIIKRLGPISALEKKELLDAAQEVIEQKQKNVSLLQSSRDAVKLVAGTPLFALGAIMVRTFGSSFVDDRKKLNNERNKPYPLLRTIEKYEAELRFDAFCSAFGALTGLLGGYLMVKGFRCSTAVGHREKAETIETLIKNIETEATE